jgi:succinate dehydrogenase / fumarate reductase flavoprotein subunit
VDGTGQELNQTLEYAGRVADFLEFSELMCRDAIERDESCGCHLREEHQTEEGEPLRDDDRYAHVAVWRHRGDDADPDLQREPLAFAEVEPVSRSYK